MISDLGYGALTQHSYSRSLTHSDDAPECMGITAHEMRGGPVTNSFSSSWRHSLSFPGNFVDWSLLLFRFCFMLVMCSCPHWIYLEALESQTGWGGHVRSGESLMHFRGAHSLPTFVFFRILFLLYVSILTLVFLSHHLCVFSCCRTALTCRMSDSGAISQKRVFAFAPYLCLGSSLSSVDSAAR